VNKKVLTTLVAVSILIMSAVFAGSVFAKPDPFIGMWTSTDIDGSTQTLVIGGGSTDTYRVRFFDDGATVCGLDPDTGDFLSGASATGSLNALGGTLSGPLPLYCLESPPVLVGNFDFQYTYDSATETLTDWLGVVWHR